MLNDLLQPSQRSMMECLEKKADITSVDERLRLLQQEVIALNSRVGKKAELAVLDEASLLYDNCDDVIWVRIAVKELCH